MPEEQIATSAIAGETVENIATAVSRLAELGASRFLVIPANNQAIQPFIVSEGNTASAEDFQTAVNTRLPARLKELGRIPPNTGSRI